MWDKQIAIDQVRAISLRGKIYFGVGAITYIEEIIGELQKEGVEKLLVVTGKNAYISCGAWEVIESALLSRGVKFAVYSGVTPNPTAEQVDAAVQLGVSVGAQAVIGIGGGSAIDAAKSAAVMLKYPEKKCADLYEYTFTPTEALPIVAVNLTHGTGTECNRFAVVSIPEKNYKPAIAYDLIYPRYAIDDPALMTGLSLAQTRYVSIDAMNHVIEAATSRSANTLSIQLAAETIRLVTEYLPLAEKDPKDLKARYFLAYAAMIAGWAFDNGLLHYTHALEHPLSAVKSDLAHGLGLAMLLPAVVENIWQESGPLLAQLFAPFAPGLDGSPKGAAKAAHAVQKFLVAHGVSEKLSDLGFTEDDVPVLTELAMNTPSLGGLLDQAPTFADRVAVSAIYLNSMTMNP
ncbi:MAG: iron-containing alcohol dehydrogenase [Lentisphaeria bacterium]|nr:iron-containing alcohol dehydrogenase [Lentisphaeria bacterium]